MGKINKRDDEFKNQCIDYYINNQITKRQVADKFGCSEASLVRWAKSLDREDYFEISNLRGDNLKKINLTDQQKQIILGTLLGDGCINCRKKSSRRRTLHVAHGIDQFDYLKWKHDVIGGNKIRQYVTGFGGIGYCFTFTHPFIEQIWKSNYVDDKKCVGVDWIKSLGPIGFATWYQDDGSLNRLTKKYKNRRYHYPRITFSTYSFDRDSIFNIVEGFVHHGFKSSISWTSKGPVIWLPTTQTRKFLNMVKPYVMIKRKIRDVSVDH